MLQAFLYTDKTECGCDEAGRGCLAGPVVAAAVILPKKISRHLAPLNDSKKLSEKQREELKPIIEKEAISFAIGEVDNEEIDRINILQASFLAMHRAIDQLTLQPDLLLIDGNRFKPYRKIKHECIIQGDGKMMSIAAASILAKTHRDELMKTLDLEFPSYHWKANKGYATELHRKSIVEFGITSYHRKSFQLLSDQLTIDWL